MRGVSPGMCLGVRSPLARHWWRQRVTVLTPRSYKDPKDQSKTYYTTWFDTWRFVKGKADEHWDSATINGPSAPAPANCDQQQ